MQLRSEEKLEIDKLFHSLRGSLTVLKSNVYFLQDILDVQQISSMQGAIHNMTRALKNYETIQQFNSLTPDYHAGFVVLQDCIEDVLSELSPKDQSRIELVDKTIPYVVYADRSHLKFVILELISNGLAFSTEKIVVTVRLSKKHFEFCVASTGTKLTVKDIDTVLTPFYTNIKQKKLGKAGLGLGLPAVWSIVTFYNWQLTITQKETTNFCILF